MKIKSKPKLKNRWKSKKGIITIPFLLVLVIVLFFILYFFGLAMTFAHISVTQYMSYSTARKFFVAGKSLGEQQNSAKNHYEKLRKQFFKDGAHQGQPGDWFHIPTALDIGDNLGDPGGYSNSNPERFESMFYGVNLLFVSYFFKFKIPFLMEGSDSEAKTRISSFLGREPSIEDCEWFNQERINKIQAAYSSVSGLSIEDNGGRGDNGC